jgi:hypothetical protein
MAIEGFNAANGAKPRMTKDEARELEAKFPDSRSIKGRPGTVTLGAANASKSS